MRIRPEAFRQEDKIREAVKAVEEEMKPDVIRIRWHFGQDWQDEWSIFFRVLVSDDVVKHRLHETAKRVRERLDERLDFEELGVFAYDSFRGESEQAELRDKAWA